MDIVALALWDNMLRGVCVFFLPTDPLHGCISQEADIRCVFFGNKRVIAQIGETF